MSLKSLKPNPDNPRVISKEDFERLKGKLQRNPDGLTANKIVYKDGTIIAGNQRFRALKELGLELKEDWFKDVSGWTDEQIREYLIVSNISDGQWDWDKLANEWSDLPLDEWGIERLEQFKDIDFDNINSTEDRIAQGKPQNVTCPECGKAFKV